MQGQLERGEPLSFDFDGHENLDRIRSAALRTGVIIRWLNLLPEGIIHTEEQVRALIAAQNDPHACLAVIDTMLPAHKATLEVLVRHWRLVVSEKSNKMNVGNMARVVYMALTNCEGKAIDPMKDLRQMKMSIICILERFDVIFPAAASEATHSRQPGGL